MKFLVAGLGSMGKRRIRLLKKNHSFIDLVGIDTKQERINEVKDKFNIKTYIDLDLAIKNENADAVLICTHPLYHSELIIKALNNNLNVFTEINLLSENYDEILNLSRSKNLKLFLSSTFLYRKEINYIKEVSKNQSNLTYRYHTGQYLPDWHPWENYKDFFVGDKKTNGCREIFAIELPWIIDTFGGIDKLFVVKNKVTSLEIDYYDNYSIILKHKNGTIGNMNVDVVSRKAVRSFEMYNENTYLIWNGTPDSLNIYDIDNKKLKNINLYESIEKDNNYSENIIENAYVEELNSFINYLQNNDINCVKYDFEKDKYILEIIDKIESEN